MQFMMKLSTILQGLILKFTFSKLYQAHGKENYLKLLTRLLNDLYDKIIINKRKITFYVLEADTLF